MAATRPSNEYLAIARSLEVSIDAPAGTIQLAVASSMPQREARAAMLSMVAQPEIACGVAVTTVEMLARFGEELDVKYTRDVFLRILDDKMVCLAARVELLLLSLSWNVIETEVLDMYAAAYMSESRATGDIAAYARLAEHWTNGM